MSKLACTAALLVSLTLIITSAASEDTPPSVYDVLESYDFPVGLLPTGVVTSYEIDPDSGRFKVYLDKSCSFTIQGYKLKYKSTISGTISKDRIKDLKGIQVKVLLFWVNIVEVTKDGDELDFSVGIASASFDVDNFSECPQCGCGFDCVNAGKKKKKGSRGGQFGNLLEAAA